MVKTANHNLNLSTQINYITHMNRTPFIVTVFGFEHALASAITGALDLFAFAGISWQRIHHQRPTPQFTVQLASSHGQPIVCSNQLTLTPHLAIEDVAHTDILLIPTIGGDIDTVLQNNANQLVQLRRLHKQGADIAANCTGTFLLAETGILNDKVATTHWGYADKFKARYPMVNVQPDKMVTEDNSVFCASGGMAWIDLALLLIERYCGNGIASDTAKSHVLDLSRANQTAYASSRQFKFHQDKDILAVQHYIDAHLHTPMTLNELAGKHNLTERTLIRRFKHACGFTPLQYLQRIRLERARKLLETTHAPIESIVNQIGYEDLSSFSRLFKKNTSLSPSQYRSKFQRF